MSNDNYRTDEWILNIFDGWFDPCPIEKTFDGLQIEWKEKNFVNPPYSNPLSWVIKSIEENQKGKIVVLLLKVDTSTEWFKRLVENNANFLWINKRLKYQTKSPANFPSMLAILT